MLKRNSFIVPSAPVLRQKPPTGEHWIHEVKFAGFRVQLHKHGDDVDIFSHRGNDLTSRFPSIRDSVASLPCETAIIDAEVVVSDSGGKPEFDRMSRHHDEDHCAWCFDLLQLDHKNLRPLSLTKRKALLDQLLAEADYHVLRYCGEFGDPAKLLKVAEKMGLEGIVSKRVDQKYVSGRNGGWVKVKARSWRGAHKERFWANRSVDHGGPKRRRSRGR
jgi:bifunctional non-homologous end joining protein LigD